MAKREFTKFVHEDLDGILTEANKLGQDGWDLIQILTIGRHFTAIFRRTKTKKVPVAPGIEHLTTYLP